MKKENRRPWWTWTPDLPRPAILILALFIDLVILSGLAYTVHNDPFAILPLFQDLDNPKLQEEIKNQLFRSHFFPRFIGILTLIQLNTEVPTMILTLARQRRQQEAKKAEGSAEAEAKFRAWYEANKDKMPDIPAPPFQNGQQNGS